MIFHQSKHYAFGRFVVELNNDDGDPILTVRNAIVPNGALLKHRRKKGKRPIGERLRKGWGAIVVFDDWGVLDHTEVLAMMRGLDELAEKRLDQLSLQVRSAAQHARSS